MAESYRNTCDGRENTGALEFDNAWMNMVDNILDANKAEIYGIFENQKAYKDDPELAKNTDQINQSEHNSLATIDELRESKKKLHNNRAPGPDHFRNEIIKNLGPAADEMFLDIKNVMFACGYTSKEFTSFAISWVHKQGKDRSKPDSYRPIARVSAIQKWFEQMDFARYRRFLVLNDLIDPSQKAYTPNKSLSHVMIPMIQKICDLLEEKQFVALTFADISKAYDCLNRRIVAFHLYIKFGLRGRLLWRTVNALDKMTIVSVIDNMTSAEFETAMGGPQGITQMIENWKAVCNTMFRKCREDISDLLCDLWGDDSKGVMSANTLQELAEKIKAFYDGMITWCTGNRCHLHPTKSAFMVFAPNKVAQELADQLEIQMDHYSIRDTLVVSNANGKDPRYLGVNLCTDLKFRKHIARKLVQGERIFNLMNVVAGKLKNNPPLRSQVLKTILKAKLSPTINFQAETWDMAPQSVKAPLNQLHRKALALCAGVTVVGAHYLGLCLYVGDLPLHIQRDQTTMRTYCRLAQTIDQHEFKRLHFMGKQTQLYPTYGKMKYVPRKDPKSWQPYKAPNAQGKGHCYPTTRLGSRGIPIPMMTRAQVLMKSYDVKLRVENMQKISQKTRHTKVIQHRVPVAELGMPCTSKYGNSSTRDPNGPEAQQARSDFTQRDNQIPREQLRIFTDGSKLDSGLTGGGASWERNRRIELSQRLPLSTDGSNMLAEQCAFRDSLSELYRRGLRDQTVQFYIDCQGIVQMYTERSQPKDHVDIVDTSRMLMGKLQVERNIHLVLSWIPSHCGIQGNENADKLAKEGAEQSFHEASMYPRFNQINGMSYTLAKSKIKEAINRVTQTQWDRTRTTFSQYKQSISRPMPYQKVGTAFQARFRAQMCLGCDNLNYTRHRFGRGVAHPNCPRCENSPETVDHFLTKCKLYTNLRKPLYDLFTHTYRRIERPFTHIGLLKEPKSKAAQAKHLPIVKELNKYITKAWKARSRYCHNKSLGPGAPA